MKILGIVGSRRKKGNTYSTVKKVLESAKENNAETKLINLSDYKINPCTGCEGCKDSFKCIIKDDFDSIVSLIQNADGVVIGSPTYWYNVSADMKLFIDRCYSLIKFSKTDRSLWISAFEDKGKWAVPVGICEQHEESMMGYTYDTLERVMIDLDFRIAGGLKGLGHFEAHRAIEDKDFMDQAKKVGVKLVNAINLKNIKSL